MFMCAEQVLCLKVVTGWQKFLYIEGKRETKIGIKDSSTQHQHAIRIDNT